jgi:POT family proton-dependent oligopeptide transporter
VSVWWALACFFGMGTGFMWYWPVTLALVSQSAPAKINATMVSASFLSLFFGSTLMGWVGSFYDQMSPAAFWMLDAAIGFAGALVTLAVRRPLMRLLEPDER